MRARLFDMVTALIFIAILVFLIVTHEFGHYLAAKLFGVRVEEFGVGYPPRAFTFGHWGGTEYTINWIPFGGFVRLLGEEGEVREKGSFVAAARWKQALILVAGVTVNAFTAWILFAGALHAGIPRVVDSTLPLDPSARLVVSSVVAGSPAAAAGISAGDTITNLSDDKGATLSKVTPETVSAFVRARGGTRISIAYTHGASSTSASVIPANAVLPGSAATPALGIGLVEVSNVSLPWGEALREGLFNTKDAFVTVGSSLGTLAASAVHGNARLQDVVGPVGLVSVVGEAAQARRGGCSSESVMCRR